MLLEVLPDWLGLKAANTVLITRWERQCTLPHGPLPPLNTAPAPAPLLLCSACRQEVVSRLPLATAEEFNAAVQSGKDAFAKWRSTPVPHRARVMFRLQVRLRACASGTLFFFPFRPAPPAHVMSPTKFPNSPADLRFSVAICFPHLSVCCRS